MKIKELIEFLNKFEADREVVLHEWQGGISGSRFISLLPACTPKANTKNLVVLRGSGLIEPISEVV